MRFALVMVPFALFTALVLWVWMPLLVHYRVPNLKLPQEAVQAARLSPAQDTFEQLRELHAESPEFDSDTDAVPAANALLGGEARLPNGRILPLAVALSPGDLAKTPFSSQLPLASLAPVELLLQAYRATGNRSYFLRARDIVLASDDWDRRARMPVSLWWNDHAIAARVQVLTDFWGVYRRDSSYSEEEARRVLEFLARSGTRLSEDRFFTVRTNHGVMQNIALLQLASAFPSLPDAPKYREVALRRLDRQFAFYISDEGVILEHSAFYQRFGLRLIAVIERLLAMSHEAVPSTWRTKFEKARMFYRQIQRPDGTLPQFGDTYSRPEKRAGNLLEDTGGASMSGERPARSWALYPLAGYSVSWGGLQHWPDEKRLSQSVVTWSNFPTRSHKHADDMSFLLWAGGQTWITNVGYWPYGATGRGESESWTGSNAPHVENEAAPARLAPRLVGVASVKGATFIDLERTAPGGVVIRRQVVEVQPRLWVVVDSTSGKSEKQVVTVWNTAHDVPVSMGANGCYELETSTTLLMEQCVIAGSAITADVLKGSMKPFVGWQVVDHSPRPANAIMVKQPTGSWTLTAFRWAQSNARETTPAMMQKWGGPEDWTAQLPGGYKLTRKGGLIRWSVGDTKAVSDMGVEPAPQGTADRIAQVHRAYLSAEHEYPEFDSSIATRKKITLLLAALLLVSVATSLIVRFLLPSWYLRYSVVLALCWAGALVVLAFRFPTIFVA